MGHRVRACSPTWSASPQPQVLRLAIDDLYTGVTADEARPLRALDLRRSRSRRGLFRYFMRQILIGVSRHIEFDLRNDLFAHLQRLPVVVLTSARGPAS